MVILIVTEGNDLVLTNIFYGNGKVHSVININEKSIALCTDNGIEIYNKITQQITD